ncbi:unnamed protein product [Blepharisma stoltei]|uniref:phosphatidylinositol 3-kinase n=1 Tax=Blepharisma stoltei TaxID=1481888 RepID=A0AAU9IG56_9CILI|nr:unnamed protein product [Blepharisma stoltei]
MFPKYTKHDDITQTLSLRITKFMDPNHILAIYDEPNTSSSALMITVKLFSQKTLLAQSSQGVIKIPNETSNLADFTFPLSIQDLPPDAYFNVYIWATSRKQTNIPAASTSFSLFTESSEKASNLSANSLLRQGLYKLFLWPEVNADLKNTPGIIENYAPLQEITRLSNNIEKFEQGEIEKTPWLDTWSIKTMESQISDLCTEHNLCLIEVELPRFKNAVIYKENEYDLDNELLLPPEQEKRLWIVPDFEVLFERINPVAEQYSRLSRENIMDHKDLVPTEEIKETLNEIINQPDHKPLEPEQRDLIWVYRYFLVQDKHSLTKFLHAVCWDKEKEEKNALELMKIWAPIDKEDALHLLSYIFSCNPHYSTIISKGIEEVRRYAVERLDCCSNQELSDILLQLVQALRYESNVESPLQEFLERRAMNCKEIAIFYYWYLQVEKQGPPGKLTDWYKETCEKFENTLNMKARDIMDCIDLQCMLKGKLAHYSISIKKNKGDTSTFEKKKAKLRAMIEDDLEMQVFPTPVPHYLDPNILLTGVLPESCKIFFSKQLPIKLDFTCTEQDIKVSVMYKNGDDLRQDQLVIQIIRLMDRLLKNVNLDMCLKPYNVIATSASDGFVEFVRNASTIHERIQKKQLISAYLEENKTNNPDIFDTFIKSCAGYCVITYLLGIGDRHLENLMIDIQGHLFHIDFGFILGKDPKPMPPPMKLCKEMVEAMGGEKGEGYEKFKVKCVEVFLQLRRHCKLIVNLFYLMIHSGLSGMAGDPIKIIDKLYERFKIGLSDEKAERYFLDLITESVNAIMPQIMEKIHVWAVYWKKM